MTSCNIVLVRIANELGSVFIKHNEVLILAELRKLHSVVFYNDVLNIMKFPI